MRAPVAHSQPTGQGVPAPRRGEGGRRPYRAQGAGARDARGGRPRQRGGRELPSPASSRALRDGRRCLTPEPVSLVPPGRAPAGTQRPIYLPTRAQAVSQRPPSPSLPSLPQSSGVSTSRHARPRHHRLLLRGVPPAQPCLPAQPSEGRRTVLGHRREPGSPRSPCRLPPRHPIRASPPESSQMVPAAPAWKQQRFGGAGWMRMRGSQPGALCRSCSHRSAAVSGAMKMPKARLWAVGPPESCDDAAQGGQVPDAQQCPRSGGTHAGVSPGAEPLHGGWGGGVEEA